jgi:hypothetical protein
MPSYSHQLDIAIDLLAEDGIRLVVDTTPNSHTPAAVEAAVADYGPRVAVIYAPDGFGNALRAHWIVGQSDVPTAVVDAFTRAGATADWPGWVGEPVTIHLAA